VGCDDLPGEGKKESRKSFLNEAALTKERILPSDKSIVW